LVAWFSSYNSLRGPGAFVEGEECAGVVGCAFLSRGPYSHSNFITIMSEEKLKKKRQGWESNFCSSVNFYQVLIIPDVAHGLENRVLSETILFDG
jgi:hypothetical protein